MQFNYQKIYHCTRKFRSFFIKILSSELTSKFFKFQTKISNMGDGQSRPVTFTESRCKHEQGLKDALLCAICKDLMWVWCHLFQFKFFIDKNI